MICSKRDFTWPRVKTYSKTLDGRLAVNRWITFTRALPSETGEGRLKRVFVTRSWPRSAFWRSLPAFSGYRPSATVRAPRRTQRWPERKKHARSKPWHLKHKFPLNSTTSCGKRVGQASTRRSDSSSWESGQKASLFWRARSNSTRKIQLLQNDSSRN